MEQQPATDTMPREESRPDREVATLTARMRSNDEEAYRTFYLRYFDRLFRYLLVVTGGNEQQAKDTLQDTLVRVVSNIKEFKCEEAFWGWLTLLARSALKDQHRKTSRYWRALERFFTEERLQPQTDTALGDTKMIECLEQALDNLPEDDRTLIHLKYTEGATVKEISQMRGLSEKAIESRLGRARRALKENILRCLHHEKFRS